MNKREIINTVISELMENALTSAEKIFRMRETKEGKANGTKRTGRPFEDVHLMILFLTPQLKGTLLHSKGGQ